MTKKYKEMDYKERGWLFGTLYGYPECCIKEHVECNGPHGIIVKETRGEDNPFMRTGFIPCEKCWNRSEEDIHYISNFSEKIEKNGHKVLFCDRSIMSLYADVWIRNYNINPIIKFILHIQHRLCEFSGLVHSACVYDASKHKIEYVSDFF